MAQSTQNLEMYRGDTQFFDMEITDENGDLIDLTGQAIWFTVKNDLADADPGLIQKTVGAGITLQNQVTDKGEAYIKLVPADTSAFTVKRNLYYDVQLKDGADNIFTIASGRLLVKLDSTRGTS